MIPLQVPGGPELLIIGFILLLFLAIGVGVIGAIVFLVRRGSGGSASRDQRVEELEKRVEELETRLDRGNDRERR